MGAGAIRKRELGLTAFHSKEEVPNMEHGLRNYWATVLRRVFSATKKKINMHARLSGFLLACLILFPDYVPYIWLAW